MKKRIISGLCSLLILGSIVCGVSVSADAQEVNNAEIIVDGSALTQDDYSKGTSHNPMLRGQYLMDGDSIISKVGNRKVYVYGQTTANFDVEFVALLMYLERLDESDKKWGHVKGYSADAKDTYYVIKDDTLKVEGGYYYRVRSEHMAGNEEGADYDETFSVTNGIWIP